MKTRSFEWKENSPQWNSSSGWTVWTEPNSPIMIQRIEPGSLSIEEAEELIEVLQAAVEFQKTSWKPKLGALAEHIEYGRVLVIGHDVDDTRLPWYVLRLEKETGDFFENEWCFDSDLKKPIPRQWESADEIPPHVVVTDKDGAYVEVLPEGLLV